MAWQYGDAVPAGMRPVYVQLARHTNMFPTNVPNANDMLRNRIIRPSDAWPGLDPTALDAMIVAEIAAGRLVVSLENASLPPGW